MIKKNQGCLRRINIDKICFVICSPLLLQRVCKVIQISDSLNDAINVFSCTRLQNNLFYSCECFVLKKWIIYLTGFVQIYPFFTFKFRKSWSSFPVESVHIEHMLALLCSFFSFWYKSWNYLKSDTRVFFTTIKLLRQNLSKVDERLKIGANPSTMDPEYMLHNNGSFSLSC